MFMARATHRLVAALVCGLVLSAQWAVAVTDIHTKDDIYEREVLLLGQDAKKITFFVKLPPGARTGADVKGVFAFCTWEADPAHIRQVMLDKGPAGVTGRIAKFAFSHQMALVSWTTFATKKAYDKTQNFDDMTAQEAARADAAFDGIAMTWRRGVDGLMKDYQLPKGGWFLYGMSRGGQWAHRIALREPELFSAIHINSSYDKPVPEASKILWLVTTGELEAGYPYSKRFYASARTLNYPIIYNAEPKLGHADSPATDRLSEAFFNYAWDKKTAPAVAEERFVGNYETHEYVTLKEAARVPDKVRVDLPTKTLADAWGVLADPVTATP